MIKANTLTLAVATLFLLTAGCAGSKPNNLGLNGGQFAPCPSTPNCVSSFAEPSTDAYIAPLQKTNNTWTRLRELLVNTDNATITQQTPIYIHAEFESDFMGFVDDVEFKQQDDIIHVRSASRLGYSDLGVNRERIEGIRQQLDQ
ncbi:DUF1499 domain-containing protein [Bermanella marisrubri]|uniref:DUF1499 domain-containing protein n=2 Tax=Bermanella marisrubri TaxID=207949 RepID=Q1N4Y3_9GAMM|nr:hypothetical protein RED65_01005 [Oceanobacter sp. RED65] [Bermanella marisrubri]QIZ85794.1 DUF1499 domain-containing protein [Bermanella marisrubri]